MDLNTPNQSWNPSPPMGGAPTPAKKSNKFVLLIVALVVLVLAAAAYLYMQGFVRDLTPLPVLDYGKTTNEATDANDAGPAMDLNKDRTSDIQSDLDKTMVEDVDQQFMEIDKDLQSL